MTIPAAAARAATPVRRVAVETRAEPEASARPARPLASPPAAETVLEGRARIDELRQRLAATRKPAITAEAVEPGVAARAVRDAVEELRTRLAAALAERDSLAQALETTRDELGQTQRDLAKKVTALGAAEKLAADRARVADDLVAEAEALAEERDRALTRIAELKSLDEGQSRLLAEAEEALAARDAELAAAGTRDAELTAALDARSAEAEELAARLTERTMERDDLASRVALLEAEVARLLGTREALAEIQRLVSSAVD
jgi:DNA repair exonuclease SbcCD ATPase subunit